MTDAFKPVKTNEYFLKLIASGLKKEIYETVFKEIFNVLNDKQVLNDKNVLINAINSGRIYYENGAFRSNKPFSNTLALELEKIGAKFKYGAYYIERSFIPLEIGNALSAIALKESAKIATLNGLLLKLSQIIGEKTTVEYFIKKSVDRMFVNLQKDLEESTKEHKVPVIDISVDIPDINIADKDFQKVDEFYNLPKEKQKVLKTPKINLDDKIIDKRVPREGSDELPSLRRSKDKRAKKLAQDYTYNMDYWVKNWKAKEIVEMRRSVLKMTQEDARSETIKKYFQNRWGIAERKAEFLARNESGIASSVLKATHYQNIGCTHFKWLESTSKEKRELHLELAKETDNKYGIGGTNIFSFDNLPIIDEKTGQKGLPQEIYNCSCNLVGVKNIQYYINRKKIENAKRNIFKKAWYTITNSTQRNNNPWIYRRFGEGQAF